MEHSRIIHHYWTSPCGILDLASIGEQLVMCDWVGGWHRAATLNRLTRLTKLPMVEDASSVIDLAQVQLAEYFDQRRQVFTVPLRLIGSEFQTRVWHALTKIPYGKTRMSRSRHPGGVERHALRNSSADPQAAVCQPRQESMKESASRTSASSSTIRMSTVRWRSSSVLRPEPSVCFWSVMMLEAECRNAKKRRIRQRLCSSRDTSRRAGVVPVR